MSLLRSLFIGLQFLLFLDLSSAPALARRLIPDDNLAYPVLITMRYNGFTVSSGSGFYLNTNTGSYFVTARHVLAPGFPDPRTGLTTYPDLSIELISYSKDLPVGQKNALSFALSAMKSDGSVKLHPTRDIAVIKIASGPDVGAYEINPKITANYGGAGLTAVPTNLVKKFDDVLVGNDAVLYGYPSSLGLPDTNQLDPLRPLLRKAFIAGRNPDQRTIILDGAVYRGNSGGPVFEIEHDGGMVYFRVVGVLTQFIPLTERAPDFQLNLNSGYSIAEPMDFVLELAR